MLYLTPSKIDGVHNVSEDGALLAKYLEKLHPYYDCKRMDSLEWREPYQILVSYM